MNGNSMESEYKEKKLSPHKKFDRTINWMFVLGLFFAAYLLGAHYLDDYKAEVLYYRLVQDGVQPEDMANMFIRDGVSRNLEFRGVPQSSFFMAYWWKPGLWSLLIFVVPLTIGIVRMRIFSPPSWLNVAYFASMVAWAFFLVFLFGKYFDWF